MHPEILHLGPFHLRAFGLMLALAFVAGTWLALPAARRQGIDENRLINLILVILVSSIAGARAFYVLTHLGEFAGDPWRMLALWEGGQTLYGGVVAGIAAGFAYMAWAGLPPGRTADVLAAPMALGSAIARLGCYLNGCCYGVPGDQPWCVRFPEGSAAAHTFPGQAVHPSQLYNAAAGVALFLVVLWLRPRLRAPGQLWWAFVALFALVRIPIDRTRHYEPSAILAHAPWGPVTDSELVGYALFLAAVVLFVWAGRRSARAPRAAKGPR